MSKDLIDNNTAEHLIQKVKNSKDLPQKLMENEYVNEKISTGIDNLNSKAEGVTSKVTNLISKGIDDHESTTDSLTLAYMSLLTLPSLICTIISSTVFALIISWLLLIALLIIIVIYFTVLKFHEKLKNSSAALVISIIASISEGIIVGITASSIDATAFAAEIAILMAAFAVASIFAKTLEGRYTANSGRRITMIVLANMGVLFIIFLPHDLIVLIPATIVNALYLLYVVGKAKECVDTLKDGEASKLAAYATLIIFRNRMEIGWEALKKIWELIQKCRHKKEGDGAESKEIKEPINHV